MTANASEITKAVGKAAKLLDGAGLQTVEPYLYGMGTGLKAYAKCLEVCISHGQHDAADAIIRSNTFHALFDETRFAFEQISADDAVQQLLSDRIIKIGRFKEGVFDGTRRAPPNIMKEIADTHQKLGEVPLNVEKPMGLHKEHDKPPPRDMLEALRGLKGKLAQSKA